MSLKSIKMKAYMLLLLLPLLAIGIFCLRYRQDIFQYYLPDSQWNDEIIYYKTIEGIKEYGIPQGYFGYNESHAAIGTLGVWSPVIYLFDVLWGCTAGWNLSSPVIARTFFAILTMLAYSVMYKPNAKTMICLSLFVVGFTLYARYLASQMADCYIVGLLILFAGLYERRDERVYSIAIRVLIVILTLMRPYFALLLAPVNGLKNDKKQLLKDSIVALSSVMFFFLLLKLFTADFFISMVGFGWLRMKVSRADAVRNLIVVIGDATKFINRNIEAAFTSGNEVGGQYCLFYLLTFIFLVLCILDKCKRKEWITWLLVNIILWFAIVFFYDVKIGSRQLMPVIIMEGFILIGRNAIRGASILLILLTCFLFFVKLTDPILTTYPTYDAVFDEQIEEMNDELTEKMAVETNNRWKNTVLWVFSDIDGDFPWQTLYALPAGMGINVCTYEYVIDCFDELSAKYIACTSNGKVAELCNENGYKKLLDREDVGIYIYERSQ